MHPGYRPSGGVMFGMLKPGKAVGWILIANIAAFAAQIFLDRPMVDLFSATALQWWQVWRYVTFQFLHADMFHLLFNMLGLYFLGMYLEQAWGTRRFLAFYLVCGVFAALTHVALAWIFRTDLSARLVGASGGVYGAVLACAILFPQIRVIVFLFPMPIRFAAALFLSVAAIDVLIGIRSAIAGGPLSGGVSQIAHLGGAATAAVWVWLAPRLRGATRQALAKVDRGAWQRKMRKRAEQETEIDRVLRKIHDKGISSLTDGEKKLLREATKRRQETERELYRL
jgi:membrane associated rhomboid family serine protease